MYYSLFSQLIENCLQIVSLYFQASFCAKLSLKIAFLQILLLGNSTTKKVSWMLSSGGTFPLTLEVKSLFCWILKRGKWRTSDPQKNGYMTFFKVVKYTFGTSFPIIFCLNSLKTMKGNLQILQTLFGSWRFDLKSPRTDVKS